MNIYSSIRPFLKMGKSSFNYLSTQEKRSLVRDALADSEHFDAWEILMESSSKGISDKNIINLLLAYEKKDFDAKKEIHAVFDAAAEYLASRFEAMFEVAAREHHVNCCCEKYGVKNTEEVLDIAQRARDINSQLSAHI